MCIEAWDFFHKLDLKVRIVSALNCLIYQKGKNMRIVIFNLCHFMIIMHHIRCRVGQSKKIPVEEKLPRMSLRALSTMIWTSSMTGAYSFFFCVGRKLLLMSLSNMTLWNFHHQESLRTNKKNHLYSFIYDVQLI